MTSALRALTWNLEWASPGQERGTRIRAAIEALDPEVVCYTEVLREFMPEGEGHRIEADADYGYPHDGSRRKVALWSKTPWEEVDSIGDPALPTGRFASGVTRGIRFVGVCIPWKDAHVSTGRKDRKPWEDHLRYCEGLGRVLQRYAQSPQPICVLGDFNQRIPRTLQPLEVAEALAAAFPSDFTFATQGIPDADGQALIDHIVLSPSLSLSQITILPKVSEDGLKLSDHVGVAGVVKGADRMA